MKAVSASGRLYDAAWSSKWIGPAGCEILSEAMLLERRDGMKCGPRVTYRESQHRDLYVSSFPFLPGLKMTYSPMEIVFVCLLFLMYRH